MSEMFTKCNGFIVSGEPLVYADSATMTGQGTVSEPFGVKSTDLFVQEPLYTGVSGNSAYIGWNNETVLFETTSTAVSTNVTLSEPITNFERLLIYGNKYSTPFIANGTIIDASSFSYATECFSNRADESNRFWFIGGSWTANSNDVWGQNYGKLLYNPYTGTTFTQEYNVAIPLQKIVGINRKV